MKTKAPTGRGRRVAVQEREEVPPPGAEALWPIAMLRIAMELKRPGSPGLEQIIEGVAQRMGIDKAAFEKFLSENLGVLEQQARDKGYLR